MVRNKMIHYLLLLVFFTFVFSLCMFSNFLQIRTVMENSIDEKMVSSINEIDRIFNAANISSALSERYIDDECSAEALLKLRMIVASNPEIRSINLYKNNNIYCASVIGGEWGLFNSDKYINHDIIILKGTSVIPNRIAFFYLNKKADKQGVLVGIDAYHLINIIKVADENIELYISAGGIILDGNGGVVKIDGVLKSIKSEKYPYTILSTTKKNYIWKGFFDIGKLEITITFFISVISTYMFGMFLSFRETISYQLVKAMKNGDIKPFIQPIIEAKTGRVIGGELLLRWNHPVYGVIPPDKFIPRAEQCGVINKLTDYSFNYIADVIIGSGLKLPKDTLLCFNVSPQDLLENKIIQNCQKIMNRLSAFSPVIILEITERESIQETPTLLNTIKAIKTIGVKISLDDFGTGNANYNYIRLFNPEYIKIDKVFTRRTEIFKLEQYLLQDILSLSKKYNCLTIAEGVETEEQKLMLQRSGINYFQGYYFSRAIEIEAFVDLINHY